MRDEEGWGSGGEGKDKGVEVCGGLRVAKLEAGVLAGRSGVIGSVMVISGGWVAGCWWRMSGLAGAWAMKMARAANTSPPGI